MGYKNSVKGIQLLNEDYKKFKSIINSNEISFDMMTNIVEDFTNVFIPVESLTKYMN